MKAAYTAYRCLTKDLEGCAMNPELTMESLGTLHGPAGGGGGGGGGGGRGGAGGGDPGPEPELLASPSAHHAGRGAAGSLRGPPPPPAHQELGTAAARSAMVTSMASILDGGDYRPELSIPLHHAMSMSCDSSPPGMGMSSTYTTLTPLTPLPPISTVSDKFHHAHPHPHPHPHHHHQQQRLPGSVGGGFALLRDERGLPAMNSLYSPYKEVPGMGQSLSPLAATPLGNGLGGLHNAQQSLPSYGPPGPDKMLSPNFDAQDRKSTRLNSSHRIASRMPSSA